MTQIIAIIITVIITPMVLLKAYLNHKENKDLRGRLGLEKNENPERRLGK